MGSAPLLPQSPTPGDRLMLSWITRLFTKSGKTAARVEAAAERAASAMEEIATGMERARDAFLARLGEVPAVATPALEMNPELPEVEAPAEGEGTSNGRRRRKAGACGCRPPGVSA